MNFKQFYNQLNESHSFSCAMLNLSKELANKIESFARKNIKEGDLFTKDDKGFPEIIHTTIKYGIETNDSKEVAKIIEGFGPIEIELGKVSKFNSDENFDVLKIEVDGKKLRKLNKLISDNMDVTDSFPEYKPHITLAYVKKDKGDNLVGNKTFDGVKDTIGQVFFNNRKDQTAYLPLN